MAVTYDNVRRAARLNATRNEFLNGTMEILSAADAVLAVFTFSATAGSVATNTWTLGFTSTSTVGTAAAGAGTTATKAQFKTSGAVAGLTGLTVGVATGVPATEPDITIDNTSIAEGQAVNITGTPTIVHA